MILLKAYDFLYENLCSHTCNLQDEKDFFQENLLCDEKMFYIFWTKIAFEEAPILVTKILSKKIWLPQADSQPTGAVVISKRKSYHCGHIKKKIIYHFKARALGLQKLFLTDCLQYIFAVKLK